LAINGKGHFVVINAFVDTEAVVESTVTYMRHKSRI